MEDFPKYPTDFVVMTRPFEEEDIKKFLGQNEAEIAFTIDTLKKREVNATKVLSDLQYRISKKIMDLKDKYDEESAKESSSILFAIEESIKNLDELL